MRMLFKKLSSRVGESITETLVALLVASLALLMLAGAVSAASRVVTRSRDWLESYYNQTDNMIRTVYGTGTHKPGNVTLKVGDTLVDTAPVRYDVNAAPGNMTVVVYKAAG